MILWYETPNSRNIKNLYVDKKVFSFPLSQEKDWNRLPRNKIYLSHWYEIPLHFNRIQSKNSFFVYNRSGFWHEPKRYNVYRKFSFNVHQNLSQTKKFGDKFDMKLVYIKSYTENQFSKFLENIVAIEFDVPLIWKQLDQCKSSKYFLHMCDYRDSEIVTWT